MQTAEWSDASPCHGSWQPPSNYPYMISCSLTPVPTTAFPGFVKRVKGHRPSEVGCQRLPMSGKETS